jgi:metal-sulfur cluster biosynthetic enzyme
MVTKEDVMKVLKKCYDPEIPINIVDLGLIYGLNIEDGRVDIKMTLTTQFCPLASVIIEDVKKKVEKIKGVKKVDIELVFDPAWSPDMMSTSAKRKIGIGL